MGKIAEVQEVTIADLIPYANNAKIHGAGQIEKLKKSITEFGFITPCLIDRDNNLIAGHGRVMAAKELGMTTVPCVYVDGLTETQRRAYILADNRLGELGEWDMDLVFSELEELKDMDFDIELTGFELPDDEPNEVEDDGYDFKDVVDHRASEGDVWQLGEHRLMCGDSSSREDVEKLTGGGESQDGVHRSSVWCSNRIKESDAQCLPEGWKADREHHWGYPINRGIVRDAQSGIHQLEGTRRGRLLVLCNITAGR